MKLTEKDIKIIEGQKSKNYMCFFKIVGFGILFNVLYLNFVEEQNRSLTLLITTDICFVLLSILVPYLKNYKYNKDLLIGNKLVKREKVEEKLVSSGRLKIIAHEKKYTIDKKLFDDLKTGDYINLHYTLNSCLLLHIEKSLNSTSPAAKIAEYKIAEDSL